LVVKDFEVFGSKRLFVLHAIVIFISLPFSDLSMGRATENRAFWGAVFQFAFTVIDRDQFAV
jgi:hypothetical protein